MRHTQRNPQKSQANPIPDPRKTLKEIKTLQKGASGLRKPKQCSIYLQENSTIEQIHVESTDSNTSSEEKLSEIHKSTYYLGSPFSLSLKETSAPIHHTPLVLSVTLQPSIIQTANTLLTTIAMVGRQAHTKMDRIIVSRYRPLILPTPLNAMPTGEYHKYMPKFTGTEGVTGERTP